VTPRPLDPLFVDPALRRGRPRIHRPAPPRVGARHRMMTVGFGGPVGPPPVGGFVATDYPGCQFWLSPRQEAYANNDPVGTGNDWSGNNRDVAQGTAGARPTFKTGGPNGHPWFDFDGGDYLDGTVDVLPTLIANNAYTIYAVVYVTSIATNAVSYSVNDALLCDIANGGVGIHFKTTPVAVVGNYDGSEDQATVAISTGAWMVLMTRHGGGNIYISKNGGSESSAASLNTSTGTGDLRIGANYNAAAFFTGRLAELAIHNQAHDAGTVAAAIAALKSTFGIA
jgi:hypothetical protein